MREQGCAGRLLRTMSGPPHWCHFLTLETTSIKCEEGEGFVTTTTCLPYERRPILRAEQRLKARSNGTVEEIRSRPFDDQMGRESLRVRPSLDERPPGSPGRPALRYRTP